MRIRFIINPIAGKGKQKGIESEISKHFNNYDIFYTKKEGDASIISKKAISENINAVIAVGGDGTLNECLKSLVNTTIALGVIPCGSGNGFAYHIGMSRNIKKATQQLKVAKIITVDSCTVNKMPFMNIAGIGFDAKIAKLFSNSKKRGFLRYILLILKELRYNAQEYTITYNGNKKKIKAYMISFANTSQYGNNIEIAPQANIKDGLLDFVIVREFARWKIPFFLLQVAIGKAYLSKYVEIIKCKNMKITSNETLLHLDGEPCITTNPIIINLLKDSLKILKPHEK